VADTPLTRSLAALSRFFVGDGTLEQTLARVVDLTVEAVPAADMVGITMLVEGRRRTPVFTHETAPEIDQAQYDSGEGPCLTAFEERRITSIESTREEAEWPGGGLGVPPLVLPAADHGIYSTLSFPLVVDKDAVGALNLYSRRERAFTDRDRETGELFASQAAIVLANAQAYWDARELSTGLGEAMKNRAVIEQAKGVLMGAQGYDEDEAFQVLVRASQRENVKLRAIAQRIVDNATARRRGGSKDVT
jgi:GAF domain-containing protein